MNEQAKCLSDALAAAQAQMDNAPLNKTNPHFRSKYADLAAIRNATIPHLSAQGLSLVQFTEMRDGQLVLVTRLTHKSEQIEGHYPIPIDKPQIMGSALTYARRYCWASMCGIAAEEDDDGNMAQKARNNASDITLGAESLSKAKSRPLYEGLINNMRAIKEPSRLTAWGLENSEQIHSMHDDFQRWFREEYQNHLTALKEGVAEDGKPSAIKSQLRASLDAEDAEVG